MAQKVNVQLIDDLDGSVAASTVQFGLDGKNYSIDLSRKHAAELRRALAPYVEHSRRTGGRKTPPKVTQKPKPPQQAPDATVTSVDTKTIRKWARNKGWQVSDRGRIPADILKAYHKSHRRRA